MQQQHFVPLAHKILGRVETNTGVVAVAAGAADPPEILGYRKIVRKSYFCLKIFVKNCEIRDNTNNFCRKFAASAFP